MRASASRLVAFMLVALVLSGVSATARAAFAPIFPAPPPSAPAPADADPDDSPQTQYEALLDIAFQALSQGNFTLSEQAFRQAAGVSSDPVRAAVATSFAERVLRLRITSRSTHPRPLPAVAETDAKPGLAAASQPDSDVPREMFTVTTSLLGLGLYGWALPGVLAVTLGEDPNTFVGLHLVTAGVSVFVPYMATRGTPVSSAQAHLAFYGGTRGAWHGALLSAALFGNLGPERRYQLWAGSLLAGSVAELTAGYFFARSAELTAGEARTIAVGGDFGLGWGMAAGAILGLHHDNHSEDAQARGIAITGILGASLGLGGGYLLSQQRDNSWGDGEVLRAAGLFGTWLGLSVDALAGWEPDQADQKKCYSVLIAGGAAGLWLGDRLVRNAEFTASEGVLVDLSTVAGGLVGAGVAYLLEANQSSGLSAQAFFSATSVGGGLGFGLAYVGLRKRAVQRAILEDTVALGPSTIAVLPLIGKKGEQGLSLAGTF